MFSIAIFLLSVCSAVSANSRDSNDVFLSQLLERLNDLEQRVQVQETINAEQEKVIKTLILENKKWKNAGMPEKEISLDTKGRTYSEGFNHSLRNRSNTGENLFSKMGLKKFDDPSSVGIENSSLNFRIEKSKKRSVTDINTGDVAFYSYLSRDENDPGRHQIILFDHVITNVGGNYNHHTGIFFCPVNGVYTFSWTVYCSAGGYIFSEIVVNSNVVGAMDCDGEGANSIRHTTGVVVVEINQGDAIFIRTSPNFGHTGSLLSHSSWRSSFSGWKLF
ncbi:uncharacterized protein LOC134278992 [Saccostrea cucullata]|uniref:uncharacterized protein LOC134278992 n=1 Tax=Saccostrea cuccullata TaxID=36930 RepID=UPI002ED6956A